MVSNTSTSKSESKAANTEPIEKEDRPDRDQYKEPPLVAHMARSLPHNVFAFFPIFRANRSAIAEVHRNYMNELPKEPSGLFTKAELADGEDRVITCSILLTLSVGDHDLEELSSVLGVKGEVLQAELGRLETDGFVKTWNNEFIITELGLRLLHEQGYCPYQVALDPENGESN